MSAQVPEIVPDPIPVPEPRGLDVILAVCSAVVCTYHSSLIIVSILFHVLDSLCLCLCFFVFLSLSIIIDNFLNIYLDFFEDLNIKGLYFTTCFSAPAVCSTHPSLQPPCHPIIHSCHIVIHLVLKYKVI